MKRICDICGATTKIRAFRYWDGCCRNCRAPVTNSEKRLHPIPTREEVADYLAYLDDLNEMRQHRITSMRMGIATFLLFLVLVSGIILKAVSLRFAIIMGAAMGIAFHLAGGGLYYWSRCPRCKKRFAGDRSREIDKCGHCGLRALSQGDLQRARALYIDDHPSAEDQSAHGASDEAEHSSR